MCQPKVVARGLSKRYGDVVAVDRVDLEVHAGEIVGVVGPNGAGKTTTLEMMEGLRKPDSGTCTVCGFDSIRESRQVRARIGLTLQQAAFPDGLRVIELMQLYASFYPDPVPIGDLLHQFDLEEKARAFTQHLSGGQKQRLALALALLGRPEVIFLDEPTTGLDPQARRHLWDAILRLKDEGRAVILSTHYMDEVEQICDRVVIMDHGKVLASGRPRELIDAFGPESVIEVAFAGPHVDAVPLSRLDGATGIKVEEHRIYLQTYDTAKTLMALALHADKNALPIKDLRTRVASMDDVFIALTGRSVRE